MMTAFAASPWAKEILMKTYKTTRGQSCTTPQLSGYPVLLAYIGRKPNAVKTHFLEAQ